MSKESIVEFIMTYGWSFLVVLACIGALAYFGVLHPDNLIPKEVSFECCDNYCESLGDYYCSGYGVIEASHDPYRKGHHVRCMETFKYTNKSLNLSYEEEPSRLFLITDVKEFCKK